MPKPSKISKHAPGGPFGVYVGRFCPMHLGHQEQIKQLINDFGENHLICIGSCNHPISFRHLFSYQDRRRFITTVFPGAKVVPLADFEEDREWLRALDDLIGIVYGGDPETAIYIGGCQEDIEFFIQADRPCRIVNRFSETPNISATQVRDALIEGRTIANLVDPQLVHLITERFGERWKELRKH
jgi:cytidyltransferase-like protein